jgi:exodeoxyribonuclease V alpha subunit
MSLSDVLLGRDENYKITHQSGVTKTIRVTAIQNSFKEGFIKFRGIAVDPKTHQKTSAVDYYFITVLDSNIELAPIIGQIWEVTGDIKTEDKPSHNGKYIIHHITFDEAKKCKLVLPKSNLAFINFISKDKAFKGIAEDKAEVIWKKFGSKIYQILASDDQSCLQSILTEKSIISLVKGYEKYKNLKYSVWLTEKGIPLPIQKRIFKFKNYKNEFRETSDKVKFSINPIQNIQNNPYYLVNFGMSFTENDAIAQKHFNIDESDNRRLIAAVRDAIKKHTNKGHTISQHNDISSIVKELLNDKDITAKALKCAFDRQAYVVYPDTGLYQLTPTYLMENVVAKRLLKLKNLGVKFDEDENNACIKAFAKLSFKLEPLQTEAILTSVENTVSCIVGGPGTGKTTVLNTVLIAYQELGYEIKAMALAGRAAMRLQESIGMDTSTIAKFLREDAIENESKCLIVIDEASMLDLPTMYRVFTHVHPSVRFIFCGDPDQLPPIGPGKILADIVDSGVISTTKLEIVKRQTDTTGIPQYSKLINEGVIPAHLSVGNITFYDVDYAEVASKCVELFKEDGGNSKCVAPTNALVEEINSLCQKAINPDGEQLKYFDKDGQRIWDKLCVNDPVLFIKNNYDANVQNGTLGKLISVKQTEKHYGTVEIDESGEQIELSHSLLLNLKPGYAMTVHKGQGSQFPRVIVALSRGRNVDRAWLYTSVTRAEHEIHIVGPMAKFIDAIKNVSNASKRQTNLVNLLQKK